MVKVEAQWNELVIELKEWWRFGKALEKAGVSAINTL